MAELPVRFAEQLRLRGLTVPPDTVVAYAAALGAVGLHDESHVYWAGRATLVRRPDDVTAYDAAFADFWRGGATFVHRSGTELVPRLALVDDGSHDRSTDPDGRDAQEQGHVRRWSAAEVLRHKDLAELTAAERSEADRMIDALRLRGPRRRSRRRRPSRDGALDLRATVAVARRAGGEPVRLVRRAPGERRRRVVLLIDVSGSMAPYARALLRFAHVAVTARDSVEVFTLGTRLTRLTGPLANHDPDAALAAAMRAVPDFEGGTRLGDTMEQFVEHHGVRGLARGAVVVVLSDGWDRGDPAVLGEAMGRLSRVTHRLVWVNPLKSSPGYAPLAGGMAAALPWVDDFVEGHSVASLEALVALLSTAVSERSAA